MKKFVPLKKQSKTVQREYHSHRRTDWGARFADRERPAQVRSQTCESPAPERVLERGFFLCKPLRLI